VEQNPYESPQADKPVTTRQLIRRALGVGTILLVTPVAVGIAFGGSCAATNMFLALPWVNKMSLNELIGFGLAVFLIPPVIVLVAMVGWAIWTYRRNKRRSERQTQSSQELQPD